MKETKLVSGIIGDFCRAWQEVVVAQCEKRVGVVEMNWSLEVWRFG